MTSRALFLTGCLLIWPLGATAGEANPSAADAASAHRSFDQGLEHFRMKDFDAAVSDFETALKLKPHPSVLFNLGRAYAAAARPLEAVRTLEQYLAEEGANIPQARRAFVTELLTSQRRQLGTIRVTNSTPGISIAIDGVIVAETPQASALATTTGKHTITASKDGFIPAVMTIEIDASHELEVEMVLQAIPSVAATAPSRSDLEDEQAVVHTVATAPADASAPARHPQPLRRVGVAALGVGVAAAAVGSYFALRARASWSERQDHCVNGVCDAQAVEAWHDAKRSAVAADISFALGLVAAGAGIYLLVTNASDHRSASATRLSIAATNHSAFVQLGGAL
jgi:tetratricopeptide (TPR) repeat protein